MNTDTDELRNLALHLLSDAEAKRAEGRRLIQQGERLAQESILVFQAVGRLEVKLHRHLTLSKTEDRKKPFEVRGLNVFGGTGVWCGGTMAEAVGRWILHHRQVDLGIKFDVDGDLTPHPAIAKRTA